MTGRAASTSRSTFFEFDDDPAIRYLKKLAEGNLRIALFGDAAGYNNRGVARLGRGSVDDAITDFTRAIECDPQMATACGIAPQGGWPNANGMR